MTINHTSRQSDSQCSVSRVSLLLRGDALLYILSGALLVAMLLAVLYGLRYSKVDASVIPGKVAFYEGERMLSSIEIDNDMNATVTCSWGTIHGRLKLDGADTDSILYKITDISFEGGVDPKGAIVMLRVPRTGLRGDFVGPWMMYYSYPADGDVPGRVYSDWLFVRPDGTVLGGGQSGFNVMTARRRDLERKSSEWTWTRSGERLVMEPVS